MPPPDGAWIRVVHPVGRTATAPAFIPEIDDEVLVMFAHGDTSHPYVLGVLYNGADRPSAD